MGAPKTTTVGGGSATRTGDQFNSFLQNQLPGGNMGGASPVPYGLSMSSQQFSQMSPENQRHWQDRAASMGHPTGGGNMQQSTPFSNAFQGLLSGQNSNQNIAPWMQQMQGQSGMSNINPVTQQYGYNTQAPSFQGQGFQQQIDRSQLPFNQQQFGQVGFSSPQMANTQFGVDPNVANRLGAGGGNVSGGINLGQNQNSYDFNSPIAQAAGGVIQQQMDRALADSRAKSSALGGNSFGTSAIRERNMVQQDLAPQIAQAQLQAIMGKNSQEMQNFGQNSSLALQNAGLNQQGSMANAQLGMQGALGLGNLQNQAGQLGLQGIGQNNQAMQGLDAMRLGQQQGINQLGLNQAQGLNQNMLQQQNQLGQLGLGMNQQSMQQQGMQNDFNMNAFNSQNNAVNQANQYGLAQGTANNQQGMQNQQMGNQFQMGLGSLLQGMDAQQQQGVMQMISQLFGGFGQSNAIGNPQAQTVQTPSGFGQVMQGISGIAGMIPGIGTAISGLSGLFGGGGSQGQMLPPINGGGYNYGGMG